MSGFVAFPAPVLPGHLKSATNQDGAVTQRITTRVSSAEMLDDAGLDAL